MTNGRRALEVRDLANDCSGSGAVFGGCAGGALSFGSGNTASGTFSLDAVA